jgi:hypothetical protein
MGAWMQGKFLTNYWPRVNPKKRALPQKRLSSSHVFQLISPELIKICEPFWSKLVYAKNNADRLKIPVVFLMGERHDSPQSQLIGLVVVSLLKKLGITKILVELGAKDIELIKKYPANLQESSTKRLLLNNKVDAELIPADLNSEKRRIVPNLVMQNDSFGNLFFKCVNTEKKDIERENNMASAAIEVINTKASCALISGMFHTCNIAGIIGRQVPNAKVVMINTDYNAVLDEVADAISNNKNLRPYHTVEKTFELYSNHQIINITLPDKIRNEIKDYPFEKRVALAEHVADCLKNFNKGQIVRE